MAFSVRSARHFCLFITLYNLTLLRQATTNGLSEVTRRFERGWPARGIVGQGVKHDIFSGYPCADVKGLTTTDTSSIGQTLLQVPLAASLSVSDQDPPIPGVPLAIWQTFDVQTKLSLTLLKEKEKGKESKFIDYFDALIEEQLHTPLHWSSTTLAKLQNCYPSLYESVNTQRQEYELLYNKLSDGLEINPPTFSRDKIPFSTFLWSLEVVRSRAFQGLGSTNTSSGLRDSFFATVLLGAAFCLVANNQGGELVQAGLATAATLVFVPSVLRARTENCALLPAIDSCNHDSKGFNCNVAYEPKDNSFVLRTCALLENQKGSKELTISYGNRGNDELLQFFGFVEIDNPSDCYSLDEAKLSLLETIVTPSDLTINRINRAAHYINLRRRGDRLEDLTTKTGKTSVELREVLEREKKELHRAIDELGSPTDSNDGVDMCILQTFLRQKELLLGEAVAAVTEQEYNL